MNRCFAVLVLALLSAPSSAQPNRAADESSRAVLAFDPGTHTRPISAMGFSKDKSKLITVAWDYSIQVWSTTTGERLDILRLPFYGSDNGADPVRWEVAAVSPDGNLVAVGGASKPLVKEQTRLVIVDVPKRKIRRVNVSLPVDVPITSLAFSVDGNRLAAGFSGKINGVEIFEDVVSFMRAAARLAPPEFLCRDRKTDVALLAWSPKGDRLAVGERRSRVSIWTVKGKQPAGWQKIGEFEDDKRNSALAWAPDGDTLARSWNESGGGSGRGIELREPNGNRVRGWTFEELTPGFGMQAEAHSLHYIAADRLFACGFGGISPTIGFGTIAAVVDSRTGGSARYFSEVNDTSFCSIGAVSADGELAACTCKKGLEAVVYRLDGKKQVVRCGGLTPIPTLVGWSNDPKASAIAWTDETQVGSMNSIPKLLKFAFDLQAVEPIVEFDRRKFAVHRTTVGNWKVVYKSFGGAAKTDAMMTRGGMVIGPAFKGPFRSLTLVPNGDAQPLVARGVHDYKNQIGSFGYLYGAEEKQVAAWLPEATDFRDMVSSPDGRYVLASTGTHRLCIYRTDGSQFPFLNLVFANGEWIVWTPQGYYAASPGGEKLIGWAVPRIMGEFAAFYPVERFAKIFRRPDVIKLALEKGSVELALKELNAKPADVDSILPPAAEIKIVKQTGATVIVQARATAPRDKPVLAMRLLLDGRPLPDAQATLTVEKGKPAEAQWEVVVPGGAHELKLLARSEDGPAVSDPLTVVGPKSIAQQPVLHRISIGINDYDDPGLKLGAAANDAQAVFDSLAANCVGSLNRFGAATGSKPLLDKAATRAAVLEQLAATRKAAKPGDLVVVFFAGHGVKQDDEFYLLTREADLNKKSLKGISLSGEDLRNALTVVECPVLLILDACHSAKAVKAFRPATDDLTRSLTDDAAGVTVMSAAMAHEVAGATTENGHFTAALLKALKVEAGVPFDPYERQLYTHHIYSVVFAEVRKATNGKQNPFLNSPWTVPPLAVREVPKP